MAFQPGDHVVYPAYGAGTIVSLEDRVFSGTTTRYYILKMVADDGEFMVPIDQADSLGIRTVEKTRKIRKVLLSTAEELSEDYKERQAVIEQMLATSDATQMSIGARNVAWFSGTHPLTGRDIQLYEDLQTQLASELALSEGISLDEARVMLLEILNSVSERAAAEAAIREAAEAAAAETAAAETAE